VRDLIGGHDLRAAYAVQRIVVESQLDLGARVVGRKIGLTSDAVQRQLGVDRPDFGVLLADMQFGDGQVVPMDRLLQPKIEAEIAFVLGADLAEGSLDAAQVRGAVLHAAAALEIVDSRVAGWDISFGDTVADNASSGLFVLGAQRVSLSELEPANVVMTMTSSGFVVSSGSGRACLGDPLNALRWLALTAREFGQPLLEGQVILSGALGPMVEIESGSVFTAHISGLGNVTARFSAA
jgi:2-keto-4-pentenoate hydratase